MNCTITGNQGGGVFCEKSSSPTLTNCTITGNAALHGYGYGGGLYCSEASPILTNCIISGNGGNGFSCYASTPTLTNCTISGNSGSGGGGGVYCVDNCSPNLTNSIVWGNTPGQACGQLSHCMTDRDPLFVKDGIFDFLRFKRVMISGRELQLPDFIVAAPDYRLRPGSPAIDAGTSLSAPTVDFDGVTRPQGRKVDIGAYEFIWDCNGNGVPDNDDLANGTSKDCNENIIPDECDIATGTSGDIDSNGVPDECLPPGVLRFPGDANGDGGLDLSDAVATLEFLFLGTPSRLPCGDGNPRDPANVKLIDCQPDGTIDISDAIAMLSFLNLGGRPHALAPEADPGGCVRIAGCSDSCR